jgi:hypothetical protein
MPIHKFGEEIAPTALQPVKLSLGQKMIGTIASSMIVIVKQHYLQGVGYFHCFEGDCCRQNGLPTVKYGMPFYVFPSNDMQVLEGDLDFKILVRPYKDYMNLKTKHQILKQQSGKNISDMLVMITCTEQQYQNFSFDLMGESDWRKRIAKEQYQEDLAKFQKFADLSLGRMINEQEYYKLIEAATASMPVIDRPQAPPINAQITQSPEGGQAQIPEHTQAKPPAEQEVISSKEFDDLLGDDFE